MRNWLFTPLKVNNIGGIAEQFVAQELLAYSDITKKNQLYYWHREEKHSNAEIDFVFEHQGHIIPIEVKSSGKGHLKSLQQYLKSHPNIHHAARIAEIEFSFENSIYDIPLYGIEAFIKRSDFLERRHL